MKFKVNKKIIFLSLGLFVAASFLLISSAQAQNWGITILGGIGSAIVSVLGWILIKVVSILVYFAQYNGFINSGAVINGWVIVRDICNMFFVLILLVIAFATILQIEEYNYKKWLPKLILMAILINFSKMICGLLIDAAQIVMLTFVNSFKDIAGANITTALGIDKWQQINSDVGVEGQGWEVASAIILAVIYVMIALIVITAMLAMIVMRIVMLWIYIVLSPAAYLFSAFPDGKKYAGQWWSQFTQNLIVGPVLAFFIWLSFTSLASFSSQEIINRAKDITIDGSTITNESKEANAPFGTTDVLVKFIISIGMLIGGMKITQEIGGVAASAAGSVYNKGNSLAMKGAKLVGKGAGKLASGDNYLARKFAKVTGVDFRPVKLKENFKAAMESSKRKDESDILRKSKEHLEAGGIRGLAFGVGAGEDYFNRYADGFMGYKGIKRAAKDVFVSPLKRRIIGKEMDEKEKEIKTGNEKRATLIEGKKPEIDAAVVAATATDLDLNNLNAELNSNQAKISFIEAKATKSGKDAKDLADLKKANEDIGSEIDSREKVVKKQAIEKFISSDAEIKDIDVSLKLKDDEFRKLKEQIMQVQKPVALQARSTYRKDVEEAKSKYKSITNSDELQKALADAIQRGDTFDQTAIREKLSSDGNLNDELRDKGYSSDAKGLYKYVNNHENDFGEKKGITGVSDASRMQILSDLSESEEKVNHWDMAKMVGMNSKGEMESLVQEIKDDKGNSLLDSKKRRTYDDTAHATAAYAEVAKMDPQQAVAKLNRLAYGGEDGSGLFQISTLGKMIYKAFSGVGGAYEKHSNRMQTNAAANLSADHIVPVLEKILASDKNQSRTIIKAITNRGTGSDGVSYKASDMATWFRTHDTSA